MKAKVKCQRRVFDVLKLRILFTVIVHMLLCIYVLIMYHIAKQGIIFLFCVFC